MYIASGIRISESSKFFFSPLNIVMHVILSRFSPASQSLKYYTDYDSYSQMLTPGSEPEKVAQPTL